MHSQATPTPAVVEDEGKIMAAKELQVKNYAFYMKRALVRLGWIGGLAAHNKLISEFCEILSRSMSA
jgi:hypothetical protein